MKMCNNSGKYKDYEDNNITGCVPFEENIRVNRLARAYVPYQIICSYFEPREALLKGTVFPSLYIPYKEV